MNLLSVAVGGAIGALGRHALSLFLPAPPDSLFPWPTFAANLTGCFIIGFFYQMAEHRTIPAALRLGLATGLLGGFTTFSTFSLEVLTLLNGGHVLVGFLYVLTSLAAGLAACYSATVLARKLSGRMPNEEADKGNRSPS
ncbi:fluoride efflux transporter CrcB [Effusibacillus consociatus]|uniref:Fluoride-specific ion channel FluC n=1 Tax=Effusibacillus consociatus TaxID=1117041 RepID=A0ABV9Q5A2_9BACL